ncbi:hypothetical protein [Fibrella aquatilis]|uniref:Uncharacterized protein n=1 Tax=Fibrella aquatilis TaxID=2817059 RepID=A0A939G256_9BACT|nr:hypothetical protein [Fibrella aquatilis]MBO0930511.1 hypothetical protein [Fibrella aquatilis]
MENQLTIKEGYMAMIAYLENLNSLVESDELPSFLGSMALMKDGSTMDPAAWEDWIDAVNQVIAARDTKTS